MRKIDLEIGALNFKAQLNDTPTADAIFDALPIEASSITWGDEIYFGIPVQADLEKEARAIVEIGDLAYWPAMPAFCIFFGPTPASIGKEPRAASPVNIFGRLSDFDPEDLRRVREGERVIISRANS